MNVEEASVIFVNSLIDGQHELKATSCNEDTQIVTNSKDTNSRISSDNNYGKHSAIWTSNATSTLLKLYESKLEMLETPKRKKMIWLAISECLKDHTIEVSPDQVRWKINALTRKYKRCVETGNHSKFKYFKDMDRIYSKYNIDGYGYTITELLERKNVPLKNESKATIEMRKIRLANRIEADRSQTKIQIEKQWLEYLHRQERGRLKLNEIIDRRLSLKEEELELRKREMELKQSLELKNIKLKEKDLNEILQLEKEKCDLLCQIFC